MAVWEYKVISSGKGGFATPVLLESFLNQLGKDEWEIVEYHAQPDNALAITGLARRPTQRDWTLQDAAAAAAKAEADKLRAEFEAKFRGAETAAVDTHSPEVLAGQDDGYRKIRDTERDLDPDAEDDTPEDEWDKLGSQDELPTFFEAIRPLMRRNQRGPGLSVGVDHLAKKWEISEEDVLGALKECGMTIPHDEDDKPDYVEYDGDLFWVNVNRRGELWVNTKEKARPVFRTVQAAKVAPAEEAPKGIEPETPAASEPEQRPRPKADLPSASLPEGPALLDRIRPMMRRNRHEPGGSGSASFLSRGLRCTEAALGEAFAALGLTLPENPAEKGPVVEIDGLNWFLNRDQRGGVWINAREKAREKAPSGEAAPSPEAGSPGPESAPGHAFAAVRLLLKPARNGGVADLVERLAQELGKSPDDFLKVLTDSGLRVPEKAREKPVFVEHAGEIFWLNVNAKGELWLNAKPSKYPEEGDKKSRRPRPKKKPDSVEEPAPEGSIPSE